jgi:serine phosphatase RsbU (regulator of sigma subunit)
MNRFIALIIQLVITLGVSAQINKYGVPIIRNYTTELTGGSEYNWCITKDKFGVVYFGNDDKGVIRYDGTNWTNIPVRNDPRIRALGTDKNGIVYVGGAYEFGYIEPDNTGKLVYVSVSKKLDSPTGDTTNKTGEINGKPDSKNSGVSIGEIISLVVNDTSVFYLSREAVFIYNINNQKLVNINLRDQGFNQPIRIFNVNNMIILAENNKGLFEYKDGKIGQLPGGEFFGLKICLSVLPFSDGKILIGTFDSGVYLYDYVLGKIDETWIDKAVSRKISKIYCGVKLLTGEYVFGTVSGAGIFIINKDGKLAGNWNTERTDLQDNNITALYTDGDNSELWISTTGFISKAYTNIPFTQFSAKSGIEGGVNGFCELSGKIYISTDNGVFRSQTDENGIRYFVKVEGINDQVFPLLKAEVGREKFVLAGSLFGLYQITAGGKASKVIFEKENEKNRLEFRNITQSKITPNLFYMGLSSGEVLIFEYQNGKWRRLKSTIRIPGNSFFQIECENGDMIILNDNPNGLYRIKLNEVNPIRYGTDKGLPEAFFYCLSRIDNDIIIATSKGLFKYNTENDTWKPCNELSGGYSAGKVVNNLFQDTDKDVWLEFKESRYYTMIFHRNDSQIIQYNDPLLLLPNVQILDIKNIENRVWLAKSKNVYVIDKSILLLTSPEPRSLFTKIKVGGDSLILDGGTFFKTLENGLRIQTTTNQGSEIPEMRYKMNSLSFYWTTPYFIEEELLQYSYKLDGFEDVWSMWEHIYYKDFTNLPYGNYTFRVKARTATDVESKEAVYEFIILKPWYLTAYMIVLYIIVFVLIILGIIKAYTWRLRNENIRLENIVSDRTSEVNAQKKEIEEKNRKITESIHYSKHIQDSILIKQDEIDKIIPGTFVYLRPRDIVSGDFYWFARIEEYSVIAAVDCTGHGVPGAFMCMIGNTLLNFIVKEKGIVKPSEILDNLNREVIKVLQQERMDTLSQDGMDMSVCTIDIKNGMMQYAGAKNPLFMVINNDLNIFAADPFSIGGTHLSRKNRRQVDFRNQEIMLRKGTSIYLFTDGYVDQFGGPENKSYNSTRFGELLKSISELVPAEQYRILDSTINDWMKGTRQIDDMLVIGIKL